ncbi:MAG: hypothetical protein JXN59_18570 [Anaerolineae bacterium]|nr:hypothetical protein [Anaerolineae bacterium]
METNTLVMLGLVMGGYLLLAGVIMGRLLRPAARRVLIGLILVATFIIGMYPIVYNQPTFWNWFFHPSSELAAGAIFSSAQYIVVALVALLIGLAGRWEQGWQRAYWVILAALFAFLCVDEYFSLHEEVLLWRYMYPLTGAAIVGLSVVAWWFGFRKDWRVIFFILVGLGLMGFAGVALDAFSNEHIMRFGSYRVTWFACHTSFLDIPCRRYGMVEEFLEMASVSLVLAGLYSALLDRVPAPRLPRLRRIVLAGAGLWVLWTVVSMWVIPSAENLLFAERIPIVYENEDLQLMGVRHNLASAAPGDDLDLAIYFGARRPLEHRYSMSIHVMSKPDAESVAQYDIQLGGWNYPSTAWIPGLAVRNDIHLSLPDDLPGEPHSYWITARVWQSDEDEPEASDLTGLPIRESVQRLITEDTVALFSLPVLDPARQVPAPPEPLDYRFAGDFALAGADLPESAAVGGSLDLAFWWQTGRRPEIDSRYIQFIHLFHENGEDYGVFDRAPFEDHFPTTDWPASITAVDSFTLELGADLPPGEYTVRTGMYGLANEERIPVTDASGTVIEDMSVTLGTITLTAP